MRKLFIFALFLLLMVAYQPTAQSATRPRLLVLGDSLSVGAYATSESNGFKHVLAAKLGADLASCRGSNLQHIVTCWESYQVWYPDIVVIEIGLNDVSNFNGLAMTEDEWIETYANFVEDIQATGARVVVTTVFHGRQPNHPLYATYEAYNQHIIQIANDSGATLADVWTATRDCTGCVSQPGVVSPFGPIWEGDNFHPSDLGHEIIARTIQEAIGTDGAMNRLIYFPGIQNETNQ